MGDAGGARKILVQIPSAQEVEQHSSSRAPPINFFRPSSSTGGSTTGGVQVVTPQKAQGPGQGSSTTFSEAFSFLRQTEFYSPPPAAPPAPTASSAPSATSLGAPSSTGNFTKQEVKVAAVHPGQATNSILVSRRQLQYEDCTSNDRKRKLVLSQGNPVLKHIRNVRWMFTDIVPDYILGQNSCALYLSLRYHLLHPDYIYFRIRELLKSYRLRVVLCHVDVDDVIKPLHEVTKTCLLHDCSLLCAWSQEECARYLETIKIYENKPADYIQERTDSDYLSRLTSALTTVRHVNKTDVVTLGSTFGTLSAVFNASADELARCPGIGERKVKRLYDAFHEPFRRIPTAKVAKASNGDISQVAEVQTQTTEANKSGEPDGSRDKDDVQRSKLINRDSEVSVREALNAVRGKLKDKSNSSRNLTSKESGVPAEKFADHPPTSQSTRLEQSPESREDEYIISLVD